MTARWSQWFFVPFNKVGSNEVAGCHCQQRNPVNSRNQKGPHKHAHHPLTPLIQETE